MPDLNKIYVREGEEEPFEIEHEGETYQFAKKKITWKQMNELLSKAVEISEKGIQIHMGRFYEEAAIAVLVRTPWEIGQTRMALKQLDPVFGKKLEKYLPRIESLIEGGDFFVGE